MSRRLKTIAAAALLWAVAVTLLYYVRHKPLNPRSIAALGRVVLDFFWSFSIILAAAGLGRRTLKLSRLDPTLRLTVEAAWGLGLLSIIWLILGVLGIVSTWFAIALLGGLLGLLRREIADCLKMGRRAIDGLLPRGPFEGAIALLVGSLILVGLIEALAPPVHFDALVYHLALPREFIRAGRLVFTPENPFWGQPLGVEMLYLWAASLGRPQTAALLGWCAGVMAVLGTVQLASRFGPGAGWLAGAALLAGESLYGTLGAAYVDWWTALYGLAAIVMLAQWEHERQWFELAIAGALAGFAIGAKYTGGVILIGALVVLVVRRQERLPVRLLLFVGAAGLVVLPWLLKNMIATGTPLYPFLGVSESVGSLRQSFYRAAPASYALLTAPFIPFTSTLLGVEGAPGFAASIGPLLAAFTPAAFLTGVRRKPWVRRAWIFFLVAWLVWGAGSLSSVLLSQPRLYLAVFPIWALLAAAGWAGLSSIKLGQVRLRRVAGAIVLTVLVLASLQAVGRIASTGSLTTALGVDSEDEFLTDQLGGYYIAAQLSEELGGSRNVLMLFEARAFYCPTACVADPWLDRWRVDLHRYSSPSAVMQSWTDQGFDYLLVQSAGVRFLQETDSSYRAEEWEALNTTLRRLELVEQVGEGYEIYRIAP